MKIFKKAFALMFALVITLAPFVAGAQPSGTVIVPGGSAPTNQSQVSLTGGTSSAENGGGCGNIATGGLRGLVSCIIYIFGSITYVLMAASVVYVVYGAFLMTTSEEKRDSGKAIIYHGIIGLFVMISIWGLVNILDSTFNLSRIGPFNPPPLTR